MAIYNNHRVCYIEHKVKEPIAIKKVGTTMNYRPEIGARVVISSNGKHGTVTEYPKKEKNRSKVFVAKDDETGCNSVTMIKITSLKREEVKNESI